MLQKRTVGSYHRRPLRDAHSSYRILRVHRPQGTKAKPSIGANRHTSQHRNGVSAAAGAPGTDAAADALAAVGVNCSASSSSELSACWLGVFSSPSFSSPANSVPANSATFNSCIRQILYTGRLYQF